MYKYTLELTSLFQAIWGGIGVLEHLHSEDINEQPKGYGFFLHFQYGCCRGRQCHDVYIQPLVRLHYKLVLDLELQRY